MTGGNTNHYTTTDLHDPICRVDSEKNVFYPGQEAHKYSCVAATTHDQHTETNAIRSFLKMHHATNGSNKKCPSINSHHPFHFCTGRSSWWRRDRVPAPSDQHTLETLPPRKYLLIQTGTSPTKASAVPRPEPGSYPYMRRQLSAFARAFRIGFDTSGEISASEAGTRDVQARNRSCSIPWHLLTLCVLLLAPAQGN